MPLRGESFMDRNLVVAIILSVVIIVGFQYYFQSVAPPPSQKQIAKEEQPPTQTQKQTHEQPTTHQEKPPTLASEPAAIKPLGSEQDVAGEKIVTVNTPKFIALVSSKGAKFVSFKLKDYKESLHGAELVDIFNQSGPETAGPTLMLTTRDETFVDSILNYQTDSPPIVTVDPNTNETSVTFTATTTSNVIITKKYTFKPDTYEVGLDFSITNKSGETKNYLLTIPWKKTYSTSSDNRFAWDSAEILLNGDLKDYPFSGIKGEEEPSGNIEWAGLGDTYFFKTLVFGNKPAVKVSLLKPKDGLAEIRVRHGAIDLAPDQSSDNHFSLYFGPKERNALQVAGDNLSKALVYSYYRVLDYMAEALMVFLRFVYSGFEVGGIRIPGTHNYGWGIILLTVLIKILFIPLSHKSMKSMKRMQDIQPQLAKIKEKYKDDKAAANQATMALFKEYKVNPMGSCWPMFLQMPVFIALYQALSYAIELRQAPFVCIPSIFLCIQDLSAPDPYYVTPIIMGGTMFLQQWLTPSAGDPTQKKMMLIMPVVFTWLFLNFPSGLVLYWLVNNVLSIAQQMFTNRMAK
jgi:YidC/Oxa1 family membrane protein insertase